MARLGRSQSFKPIYGLPVWLTLNQQTARTITGVANIFKNTTIAFNNYLDFSGGSGWFSDSGKVIR